MKSATILAGIDKYGLRLVGPMLVVWVVGMNHARPLAAVALLILSVLAVRFVVVTVQDQTSFKRDRRF